MLGIILQKEKNLGSIYVIFHFAISTEQTLDIEMKGL